MAYISVKTLRQPETMHSLCDNGLVKVSKIQYGELYCCSDHYQRSLAAFNIGYTWHYSVAQL